jgi:hypothetical protein
VSFERLKVAQKPGKPLISKLFSGRPAAPFHLYHIDAQSTG